MEDVEKGISPRRERDAATAKSGRLVSLSGTEIWTQSPASS